MNVGELKKRLQGVPDNYEVTIVMDNAVEALWRSIDSMRIGWRGLIAALVDPPPENYRDNRGLHTWAAFAGIVMWKGRNLGEFRIANGGHCPSLGGKYDQPEAEDGNQLQISAGQGIAKRKV